MAHHRKGDFQLSLGFIISVVFAIVLLSVAIVWLRGTIGDITDITKSLSQETRQALTNTFRTTATTFSVYPNRPSISPGGSVAIGVGIRNDASDGLSHLYAINVIPEAVSSNICETGLTCLAPGGKTLVSYLKGWIPFSPVPQRVDIGKTLINEVSIKVPANAVKGTYIFSVVSCYDRVKGSAPSSELCTQVSENQWGGSAQQILLEVV